MNWIFEGLLSLGKAFHAGLQLFYGIYYVARLRKPIVSVFGGGRVQKGSHHAQMVYAFAQLCVKNGYSVLTGGGPGVMEAANCGARDAAGKDAKHRTLGVSVHGVDEGFTNPCAQVIKVRNFMVRKRLLMHYSVGFVIFPGGIGTVDELFDVLLLAKHHRIKRIPVILVDTEYWKPLVTWYRDHGLGQGFIKEEDRQLLLLVDTIEDALAAIDERAARA